MAERKYWDPEIETMPPDRLKALQLQHLQEMVAYAYERTPLYRRKLDAAGVRPQDISHLEDVGRLPLTSYQEDFCATPLEDKLAVPMEKVKAIHTTSGTVSGFTQPRVLSKKDEEMFYDQEARGRWTLGVRPQDMAQILTGFDCCHRGYATLGATYLFLSAGRNNLDQQIKLAMTLGVTVLEHLPSLILRYFDRAREMGYDLKQSRLRVVSGVGEGWAEAYKRRVEEHYGLPFRTLYGSVEAGGVVSAQCPEGTGMHYFADRLLVEVIDPETEQVQPPGVEGELVMTPLYGEAMPLIRYRMGDWGALLPEGPCPCGRTHPKLSMVRGRVAHRFTVGGRKLLPIDVEEVLAEVQGVGDEYRILLGKGETNRLILQVEHAPDAEASPALRERVEEALHAALGLPAQVELMPPGSLSRMVFKVQRIVRE